MQKLNSTLKLPKIDDYISQKNAFRYQPPSGPSSAIHSPIKPGRIYQESPERAEAKSDYNINPYGNGLSSSDKTRSYGDLKDDKLMMDPSMKQTWMLNKLQAQRDTFQKSPPYFGMGSSSGGKSNTKISQLNQMLGALPQDNTSSPGHIRRRYPFEDPLGSKSVNMGSTKSAGLMGPSRLGLQVDTSDPYRRKASQPGEFNHDGTYTPNDKSKFKPGLRSTINKNDKLKFPMLNAEIVGSTFDAEGEDKKIDMDLIIKIDEKIRAIFEERVDRVKLAALIREYFELFDSREVIQVESFFVDTRVRKNIKSYLMLEKTSIFALLSIIDDDEMHSNSLNNICNYLYANFLNLVDSIVSRLELIPRFSNPPALDQLRQIARRKVREIDRSFGIEQINKLLLKVVRSYFKSTYKKGDRFLKLDLLMEKIEFGLMVNYFDDLKGIFSDLVTKYNINASSSMSTVGKRESPTANKTPTRPTKPQPQNVEGKRKQDSSAKKAAVSGVEALLPPPVIKPGRENKPVYTLVLDMDETLIHFEEVAGRGRFFVRPHAEEFLKEMSQLYELVIFTAGVQEYADAVLNILDPNNYITHRLYRHHVTFNPMFPGIVKDLSIIGRDLSKTIIVDNAPENFRMQLDNGIEIITWYNDPYDTELASLTPFLKDLVENQVEDVRTAVKLLRENKKLQRH